MMNKEETYKFLDQNHISYEITEHQAVFSMNELCSVELPHPDCDAKNLFVRDDKKQNYYLITVKGNKRADLKDFRRKHGLRPLSFASPDELMAIMHLTPGSVTPLGVLSDEERKVQVFLDDAFCDGLIGIHPNDNTATVWLKTNDLVDLIKAHGNKVEFAEV